MSSTPTSTRPDTSGAAIAQIITSHVAGDPTLADRVAAALPAAIDLYEQVRAFVDGEHGQAITAYWKAWEGVENMPDWLNDASTHLTGDIDVILYGIVGLLEQLSRCYPECPAIDQSLAEDVVDRQRSAQ